MEIDLKNTDRELDIEMCLEKYEECGEGCLFKNNVLEKG